MNNEVIRKKIKSCFNRSYKTYDQHSSIQEKTCFELIKALMNFSEDYTKIADFACGTGIGVKYLNKYVEYKKMYAVDFSTNLLSIAKEKYGNGKINFILSDFDRPIFDKNTLNLIVCNMGLQWSLNLVDTLKLFHEYLIKSGRLAFSMPLDGTFCELNPVHRNAYYNEFEVKNMLTQAGFTFELIKKNVYVEKFSSQIEAIRSIKLVGANCKMKGEVSDTRAQNFFIDTSKAQLSYVVGIFVVRRLN